MSDDVREPDPGLIRYCPNCSKRGLQNRMGIVPKEGYPKLWYKCFICGHDETLYNRKEEA